MDTFLAYVGAYVFHCDISRKRVKIFIDFQEAEILSNQRRVCVVIGSFNHSTERGRYRLTEIRGPSVDHREYTFERRA